MYLFPYSYYWYKHPSISISIIIIIKININQPQAESIDFPPHLIPPQLFQILSHGARAAAPHGTAASKPHTCPIHQQSCHVTLNKNKPFAGICPRASEAVTKAPGQSERQNERPAPGDMGRRGNTADDSIHVERVSGCTAFV